MSAKSSELEKKSFRELMDEFESTCVQFDSVEMDIEQALELHARANELLGELERRLKLAETKVKKAES